MILGAIALLEVLFWVFLVLGLLIRYALGWQKVSITLLILTPLTDFVQLILAFFDIANGSNPNFLHGMAAFYIGFSIAGGQQVVRSLDVYFDRRFNKGQKYPPVTTNKSNLDKLSEARHEWRRAALAGVIALAIMLVLTYLAGFSKSFWMIYWIIVVIFTVITWWLIGPWRLSRKINKSKNG